MGEWEKRPLHHHDQCRKCRRKIAVFVEHEVHLTRCAECVRDELCPPQEAEK